MEIITIDSALYKELVKKIDLIVEYITSPRLSETKENVDDVWVDNYEVCTFLRISERTLQRLRSNGLISYSVLSGKSYYKIGEIKRLLESRLIRASNGYLDNLIEQHKQYNEIRKRKKPQK